jgi:23S rRNA pseudouridine2605 synthase
MTEEKERIAKIIARAGVCSRRDAERLIAEGRVKVNGQVLETAAFLATVHDDIRVDGKSIPKPEGTRLFLYYKPSGLVTTAHDPQGRDTVFDHLPQDMPRVISVGRLDLNTEGLLLLTNDGELSRHLELPSTGLTRTYRVRAYGSPTDDDLQALADGISYEGVNYGPIDVQVDRGRGDNTWMTMKLTEGKNREIRNVTRAIGMQVNRLIRLAYGPFELGDMQENEVIEVKQSVLQKAFPDFFKGRA